MYNGNSSSIHEYVIDSILKGNLNNSTLRRVDFKDSIDIQREQDKYRDIIIKINEIKNILSEITEQNYEILICNSYGFLIDKIHMGIECFEKTKNLEIGMSIGQNKYGESAVSLSILLGRSVNLTPMQKGNRFLVECYEYCLPLIKNESIFAYLCIVANSNINFTDTLLIDIAHFIKFTVCYKDEGSNKNDYCVNTRLLSKRQIQVLIRMGKGMTEYAISKELGICEDTVRFHKRNIFEKLNVNCTVKAVIQAIKRGYLTLNDI